MFSKCARRGQIGALQRCDGYRRQQKAVLGRDGAQALAPVRISVSDASHNSLQRVTQFPPTRPTIPVRGEIAAATFSLSPKQPVPLNDHRAALSGNLIIW